LTRAETSYKSIRGEIATAWRLEGAKLKLDVLIPANTTATVILPGETHEIGSGRYSFVAEMK
jgi:alpha-L-rhamnosidase